MPFSAARRFQLLQTYCEASAILAVAIACLVLYGWAFRIEILLSVFPGFVTMKANTALGIGFSGIALWLVLPSAFRRWRILIARLLAGMVLLIGIATLCEYLFSFDLGIDQLVFRDTGDSIGTASPGRLAPTTAITLAAIGLGLILIDKRTRRGNRPAQVLGLCAGLIALLSAIGYLYHAIALTRLFLYTQMAVHTTVALLLLSSAIFFARPHTGIAGELTSDGSGGVMARRLLLSVFLLPILLGWIGLRGHLAGLYGVESTMALYASASILVFAVLIWSNAQKINEEHGQRSRAEALLRGVNIDLEELVTDRTMILEQQAAVLREQAALLDLAPGAIVVCDMENRVLFWNGGAETVYGWSRQEAMGGDTSELLKTEFFDSAEKVRGTLMREGHWEGDAIQYRRDGTRIIVASRSALQRDAEGMPVKILTINNDITARKQIEEALREREESFRDMANNISQLAWMADDKGWIFWYNQRWFDYTGATMSDVAGWGWQRVHHPDHVQGVVDKISRCFLTGEPWQDTFPLRGKDGNYRWFLSQAVPIRNAEGKVLRWFGTNTDITDLKDAESRVQSLNERMSMAAEVARIGVWEWDISNNAATWDATMCEIYDFPVADTHTYEQWAAAVYPEDLPQAEAILRNVVAEKGQGNLEFRIQRADGTLRNISGVCRAILDENATVSRVIGVNMDVTERKIAEKALEQRRDDQLCFKDEFLSHVSHEIRSPLAAITEFTSIVLDGIAGALSDEQREYELIVLRNARQLQSMIDDLLEVTRLENGKLSVEAESLSVPDAVSDTLDTLHGSASAGGVSLSCQFSSGLPAAYADPTRLRQILIILADNGIKFTPIGGEVTIRVRVWERDPEFLCLEVEDTGCGIEAKSLERIFDRLYQASDASRSGRKGLGLGLFICKELITRQGGQIWIESQLQKGSTFSFTLPIFSLKKLVSTLLNNGRWPKPCAALVTVEIRRRGQWASREAKEDWVRDVRRVLRSCTMANRDVLLPKMNDRSEWERFLIAAFADEKGVSILCNRIREQFERNPHLVPTDRCLSLSHIMLNPFTLHEGAPVADMVNALVSSLEEAIRSHGLAGMANDAN